MSNRLDLGSDRVVFKRIHGRVVPIRIGSRERVTSALKSAVAPSIAAAVLSHGIATAAASGKVGQKIFSVKNAQSFFKPGSMRTMAKVAGLAVAFSVGYNLLFGKRQKHVVELDRQPRDTGKARIWLGSKPGFVPGHHLGEHSYLYVRDNRGKVVTYGGQIKNAAQYGKSGVKLKRNFVGDRIRLAHNVHDLTPTSRSKANEAVARVHHEAAGLGADLKAKDYKYRSIPIKKNRYNSNSVTGSLVRRSGLSFRYDRRKHNLPGFNRTIPRG